MLPRRDQVFFTTNPKQKKKERKSSSFQERLHRLDQSIDASLPQFLGGARTRSFVSSARLRCGDGFWALSWIGGADSLSLTLLERSQRRAGDDLLGGIIKTGKICLPAAVFFVYPSLVAVMRRLLLSRFSTKPSMA